MKGNSKDNSDEFKKLVQVPILKKDLNRVLKVCATYNSKLSNYFHNLVLKSRRPHEIDLSFQKCLSEAQHHKQSIVGLKTPARILLFMLFLSSLYLGSSIAAASIVFIFSALFEYTFYRLASAINYQTVVLFELRNLLYSSLDEKYVPPKYRPRILSDSQLQEYQVRLLQFSDYVARLRNQSDNKTKSQYKVTTLYEDFEGKPEIEDFKQIEDAL
jgi:hypothetical protein